MFTNKEFLLSVLVSFSEMFFLRSWRPVLVLAVIKHIINPLFCLQGKNHSKKLRNFYAGSQQPPPIRIPEVVEPVSQQPSATPPTDSANVTANQVLMTLSWCILSEQVFFQAVWEKGWTTYIHFLYNDFGSCVKQSYIVNVHQLTSFAILPCLARAFKCVIYVQLANFWNARLGWAKFGRRV